MLDFKHRCSPEGREGEIVILDRSWYNRARVEYVIGFCTREEHECFLQLCLEIERYIVNGGTQLIKFWLEAGKDDQERRFLARIKDPAAAVETKPYGP
jgi:polyphosphate kinase 2 (PPK2 family)